MENIRYKNLLKAFRWLINIALYVQIAGAVVIFVSFFFMLSGEGELISSYEVALDQQPTEHAISSKNTSLNNLKLVVNQGTIQFTSRNAGYYILKIIDAIFLLAVSILITVLLKKIVKSMEGHHPFTMENTLRIRKIAFLLMSITPYSLIQSFIYRSYILKNISIEGLEYTELFSFLPYNLADRIWVGIDVDLQALITGIILIIIAEVFRIGLIMKLDNESIL